MQTPTEKFLYCHEARVIRYELGKTPYRGICTSDFSLCPIFCYQSKDKRRMSLIHVSRQNVASLLLEEALWIGEGGRCTVYTRNRKTYDLKTRKEVVIGLPLIEDPKVKRSCQFEIKNMGNDVISLLLRSNGEVQMLTTELSATPNIMVVYHPCASQIEYCAKLNELLSSGELYNLRQQLLLYNGTEWQQLQSDDLVLHPKTREAIKALKVNWRNSLWEIHKTVREYLALMMVRDLKGFENTTNLFDVESKLPRELKQLIDSPTDDMATLCVILSHTIQLFLLKNNGPLYFNINLLYELNGGARPETPEDFQLAEKLRAALTGKNPVVEVCNLLKDSGQGTFYKQDIIGLVLGKGGYLYWYNKTLRSRWIDLSPLEGVINQTQDLGEALRYLAVNGTVEQVETLAKVIHHLDATDQSGKTALQCAIDSNKLPTVECLLRLGADAQLCDTSNASAECRLIFDCTANTSEKP